MSATATAPPRIKPGRAADIGRLNALIASVIGQTMGTVEPPHLFTTLARHRRLYGPWLRFAGRLMPGGKLPRVDSELVILRVAHNCFSEYEWRHHERIAPTVGLSAEQVRAVRDGAGPMFDRSQNLLLRATDALHADRYIPDELWDELRSQHSEVELIELCMLVGHYEMLAMTLNSLRVEPDRFNANGPPRIVSAVSGLIERRRARS